MPGSEENRNEVKVWKIESRFGMMEKNCPFLPKQRMEIKDEENGEKKQHLDSIYECR